jgi:hypothetical protein
VTYLKRGPITGLWPDPLLLAANERDMPANARAWATRHNAAVRGYDQNAALRPGERVILTLAEAIWMWTHEHGGDGFGDPHVLVPLMGAFRQALNFELGRLDGGTLDGWVCDLADHLGLDPDQL